MTNEDQQTFAAGFNRWFRGNKLAVMACLDLLDIVHLWDDIQDGDKPIIASDAVTMRKAMLDLPSNPFWASNQATLLPVINSAYLQWKAANVLEKSGDDNDRNKAYMLRASLYQVFHTVAALCGGIEWAVEIGPEIYRLYGERLNYHA